MDFLELSKKRFSVRDYLDREIEPMKLEYVLECGRLAPSAANRQPWKLYVVEKEENKVALRECYARDWFAGAPLYIVVCIDKEQGWSRSFDQKNHADIDSAIITEHLCLAAADCGLGTCWVCHFDPAKVSKALNLPAGTEPVVLLSVGYPASATVPEKTRKPMSEIVEYI